MKHSEKKQKILEILKEAQKSGDLDLASEIQQATIKAIGTYEFDKVEGYNILDSIMGAIEDYGTPTFNKRNAYGVLGGIIRINE